LIRLTSRDQTVDFQESGIDQAMQSLVRESFIFHVTTSHPFQQDSRHYSDTEEALALAEEAISRYRDSQSAIHIDSPVLGFPPKLFRCIYIVYRLYQTSDQERVGLEACQRIDDDLSRWEDCTIASTRRPTDVLWMGPKLYILGCRILLRRISPSGLMPALSISQLAQESMDNIRQLRPAQDYYADYYCWPFLVIGMNLGDKRERDSLLRQVRSFEAATNNGTMRRLVDILRLYWETH
jgi:hypothetical protein